MKCPFRGQTSGLSQLQARDGVTVFFSDFKILLLWLLMIDPMFGIQQYDTFTVFLLKILWYGCPTWTLNLSSKCPASLRWALSWENTDICHIYIIYIYMYIYIYIYMYCITPHFLLHLRQSIALPLDCPRSRWQSPGPGGSRGVAGREP